MGQRSIYEPKSFDFAWEEFQLHELHVIVRQSGDPGFAALLREGNHTPDDIEEIKSFEKTDTSEWPDENVFIYENVFNESFSFSRK